MKNLDKHIQRITEAGFSNYPKGWNQDSVKKFGRSLSKEMKGGVKSKGFFDKCVKKMEGRVSNPEGFCASIKDEVYGSTMWRGKDKPEAEVRKDVKQNQNVKERLNLFEYEEVYWINQCSQTNDRVEDQILCLDKARALCGPNVVCQQRIDRFRDAVTGNFEGSGEISTPLGECALLEINELMLLHEKISLDDMKTKFFELKDKAKKVLREHDVDLNKLKATGKKIGKNIKKHYDSGMTPKDVAKMFQDEITKSTKAAMKPALDKLEKMGKERKDIGIARKIIISLTMLGVLIILSIALLTPLTIMFGPKVAAIINIVLIAPMLEEAMKSYFISMNMGWSGTTIVFGLEFISYFFKLLSAGMSIPTIIAMRTAALMMHYATTYVQTFIRDDPSIKTNEKGKYAFIAWISGVAIHMTWNSVAIASTL